MERNQSPLPSHLARWVRAEVQENLLDESALNCGGCTRFIGKCCTFQPYVANYNMGESYSQSAQSFFAPLGHLATHAYQLKHRVTPESERGVDLLCSFYNQSSGDCGRWSTRPAECAAHFCESTHGARGTEFWRDLSVNLNQMEVAVAQMAMVELGFSHRDVGEQINWLVRPPKNPDLQKMWRDWYGRESEYYQRCAEWAAGVSREQVEEWLSETGVP